jgi:tRNA-2-methylthio-N6-dimethylallyladenosine synthase
MKLFVQTFGCQMNVADSGEMSAHFFKNGFTAAASQDEADVVLLNTCTVRQHAEDKALSFIGRLRDWKLKDPSRLVVVAGCAAERMKDTLKKRFPHVDLVIGAKSIEQFPALIKNHLRPRALAGAVPSTGRRSGGFNWFNESEAAFDAESSRAAGKPMVLGHDDDAFVTIMRGCNYSCSYCIVPAVRGRETYRTPEEILDEVRAKVARGSRTVMLLGQTVNSYWHKSKGSDGMLRLIDFSVLLRQVAAIPGVLSIKFMSPHPHYMSDKLIETLGEIESIHPEIHMPVCPPWRPLSK